MTELPELVVYALTALLGVAAGMAFAAPAGRYRVFSTLSGALTTVSVVAVAVVVGSHAVWMGPLYAVTAAFTALLVSAALQADHPGLFAEPYWRRVVLIVFHQRRLAAMQRELDDTALAR